MSLRRLINEATDTIIEDVGVQILNTISRENIENKVVQIISNGINDITSIVDEFIDIESKQVHFEMM